MKILHTADWHLGQKFKQNLDRIDEHQYAIKWLLDIIKQEKIDLLIIAGDVFDTPNPPNNARALYYDFLIHAVRAGCENIVVIGGNHDSPKMLNAPKEILSVVKTHVVGAATENVKDEIIPLYNDNGELKAIVAAIPFLRDRDLKKAVSGESGEERISKIKKAIREHYHLVANEIVQSENINVPIIATGHLYAKGAVASDKQDNIYIGDMENIAADHFPPLFDYVALGHIHKAQVIGKQNHIRYAGSLIPMSFGEWKDQKSITLLEFEQKKIKNIQQLKIPLFRRLVSLKGEEIQINEKLLEIIQDIETAQTPLEAWIEILITSNETRLDIFQHFTALVKDYPIRILRVSYTKKYLALDALSSNDELDHLEPVDVFRKKCETADLEKNEMKEIVATFKELLNWMQDDDDV